MADVLCRVFASDDFEQSGAVEFVGDVEFIFQQAIVALSQYLSVYGFLLEHFTVLRELHDLKQIQNLEKQPCYLG